MSEKTKRSSPLTIEYRNISYMKNLIVKGLLLPFSFILLLTASLSEAQTLEPIFNPSMTPITIGPTDSPSNEGVDNVIDGDKLNKFLNFEKNWGASFYVNTGVLSIVKSITITTGDDHKERDPKKVEVYGRFIPEGTTSTSSSPEWVKIDDISFSCRDLGEDRYTDSSDDVSNDIAYNSYWIRLYNPCDASTANSVQISEVQLHGILNQAPSVIFNEVATGSAEIGKEITATYDYSDPEEDTESGTTFQWYVNDVAITGAISVSYTPTIDQLGKELKVEITPNDGTSFGTPVTGLIGTVSCTDGFTCESQDVSVCDSNTYQVPNGPLVSEAGSYESVNGTVKTYYNVTFERAEATADVFSDGLIAASGSVSYTAQTNATGVLTFDKDKDYWVDMNALQDDLNGTSRSVFMWVKSEANVANDNQVLFAVNTASGGNVALFWIDNEGDNLEIYDSQDNQSASFDMSDQLWHYVGYTYDASTTETIIYVDGIENDRFKDNQATLSDSQYSLGQEFDNANDTDHFNGDMAEISIWNEVLTGAEIREAMKSKINNGHPKYANLVGYYSIFGDCDDDITVLKDHSGKGNDGVMKNNFTVDFKNVQSISGFNAIDWYENISWKKDGNEVSTNPVYTFDVATGDYELLATRSFIKSTDVWTLIANSNATTVDNLSDETLCSDDVITKTVSTNAVNYLDFEESEDNYIDISGVTNHLAGTSRSVFMWVNKESNVASGDNDILFAIHDDNGTESVTNFYIRDNEKLAIYDGDNVTDAGSALANDTWYFVGYTYDAASFETKIYLDGSVIKTFTEEMPVGLGNTAYLGMELDDNGSSDYFDGKMAEISIWNESLTEEQVTSLMAAAPAYNSANLVASYGTLKNIADNRLLDLTANGNDGHASHNTIFVTTEEIELADYDASNNYTFSWKKEGTEFDTDASADINIGEGTTNYTVTYGTPLFQKTDDFALSYTNLLPTQPVSQTVGVTGSVTFEVDEIAGASYQWYEKKDEQQFNNLSNGTFGNNIFAEPSIIKVEGEIIYVATRQNGLFVSSNQGRSWISVTEGNGIASNGINNIYTKGDTVLVFTASSLDASYDAGLTWKNILSNKASSYFVEDNTIYITSSSPAVYKTTDFGTTLTTHVSSIRVGNNTTFSTNAYFRDNSYEYAFVQGKLSRKPLSGSTWETISYLDASTIRYQIIGDDNYMFYSANGAKQLVRSSDNGDSWEVVYDIEGVSNAIYISNIKLIDGVLYTNDGEGRIFRSTDYGDNWNIFLDNNEGLGDILDFQFSDNGDLYVSGDLERDLYLLSDNVKLENSESGGRIQGATTHQLTINNLSLDENAAEYFVEVTIGECTQASDDVTLTVVQAPIVDGLYPETGSTDVDIDEHLTIEFNDDVEVGNGTIQVYEYETDELVRTFSTEVSVGFDDYELTLSGGELLSIDMDLEYATKYYVLADAGVVVDENNNPNLAITDKDYWTFTTQCEPLVLTQLEDQTGFIGGSVTFSVPEVSGANYQWFKKNSQFTSTLFGENSFPLGQEVQSIFMEGDNIYAATRAGLAISHDDGVSWTTVGKNQNGFSAEENVKAVFAEGEKVYAGTTRGLSISSDGGSSWTTIGRNENGFADANNVIAIYASGNNIYVGTNLGLSISTDGGASWITATSGQNGFAADNNVYSVYALNNIIFAGTGKGISISRNGGASWTTTTEGQNGFANSDAVLTVFVNEKVVYAGSISGGLSKSSNGGGSWTTVTAGQNGFANSNSIKDVFVIGDAVYVATASGLSISEDKGGSWETINAGENGLPDTGYITAVHSSGLKLATGSNKGVSLLDFGLALQDSDSDIDNKLTGSGTNELIINNLTGELDQAEYYVVVTKEDCQETSNAATLTVTEVPPTITSLKPADDEEDVVIEGLELQIKFDQNVEAGTGNIEIRRVSDDVAVSLIDVTSFDVGFFHNVVDVTSLDESGLEAGTEYCIYIPETAFKSTETGVLFPGISDKTTWSFTTEASGAQLAIASLSPTDDAVDLSAEDLNTTAPNFNTFWITFTEGVKYGNTSAEYKLYTASDDQLVASQTLSSTLAGPPIGNTSAGFGFYDYTFEEGTSYYILIDAGMYKSVATDEEFPGITDKTTWSFTTALELDPISASSFAPEDNSTNVPLNIEDHQVDFLSGHILIFDAAVKPGSSGLIQLFKAEDNSLAFEINTANDPIIIQEDVETQVGPAYILFGQKALIINADVTLEPNIEYYWLLEADLLVDDQTDASFAGISDPTTWSFTTQTVETEPLEVSATFPSASRDALLDFPYLNIEFNEQIALGNGQITIYRSSDNSVFETLDISTAAVKNSGRPLQAQLPLSQNWEAGTSYYIHYPKGIITNLDGTKQIEAVADNTTFAFDSENIEENIITGFFPTTGSNTYRADSEEDLVIYTSVGVALERDPLGSFRIYKASNDELVKTIEYDGENGGDLDYGDDDNYIKFEFDDDELEPGTEYYVLVDDGFIISYEEGLYHVGISDPNTWRFTTLEKPSTPALVSTSPANNATGVPVASNIELTFSENIQAYLFGEGSDQSNNVVLYDADNNVVEPFATKSLTYSGAKVIINPTANLDYNTTYYLLIDDEAFVSNNGVKTAAITDPATISFTTGSQPNTAPVASNVTFAGNLEANQELSGSYDYSDVDTDVESGSTLQWFVADDVAGSNRMAISGATSGTFTLTSSEVGKFITFGVTPNDGADAGTRVLATYDGPVVAAVVPTVESIVPADGAVDVAKDANLSLTMSEAVTAGAGNITLTPTTGTATVIDVTSNEVTISGTDVTIDPNSDLIEGQFYTVTFDASAFVDADGNNSAGLTSQTAWNFTIKEANVAPEAQGVSIKKSLVVDGVLEGSYTYSDANDNAELGTTFQWYRSDDASGTGRTSILGGFSENYAVVNDDNGKYLSFEVTPNDGTLAGTPVESALFGPIIINDGFTNIPPAFTSDALTSVLDNAAYSYTITYEDLNNDVPTLIKTTGPDWLSVTGLVLSGNPTSANVGDHDVVLTLDDQNGGAITQEFTVTVLVSNTAPSVNGVEITGTTVIDEVLTATYNFIDAESDADNSTFKWYRSDDNSGTGKTEITGATSTTYTLTSADAGKFISFEVTPNDGTVDGAAQESSYVGAVAKKTPSLSLADIVKTYGDADFDLSATTNSSGVITYSFNNDQTGANLNGTTVTLGNAGEITVDVSLAEDAEYQSRQVQGTITIGKKAIELTVTNASKKVGDADPDLTYTVTTGSVVGSDEVVTISRDAGEEAGTYAINLIEGADAGNYELTTNSGVFIITQNAITITADAVTKTYGDNDPDFTYSITSGSLNTGDELSGAVTRVNGEDVGTYALESSLFNPDYKITFVSADLTIEKATLTATAEDLTKKYGKENPELSIDYSGFATGDSEDDITEPTISTVVDATTGVGTYAITLAGGAANNYNIVLVNGSLTVEKAELTATADDKSKTYGEVNPAFTIVYSGFVNGDDEADITEPTASTTADETTGIGIYDISLTGGTADNYSLITNNGSLTINQATLTATADDQSKTYGEQNPEFTITYSGFVNGDDESVLTSELTASTTADATTGVGVYDIRLTGGTATNYSFVTNNGSLTIGKSILTATADDQSKAYGEANPTFTISYNGFVNGDDKSGITEPTVSTSADETTVVGTYDITLSGGTADNYSLITNNGSLTIGKATLTATGEDRSKTYGEANPAFTIKYTGFVNGDDETDITEPTASTIADQTTGAGVYDITLIGGAADNYSLITNNGSLTIEKATLTVMAEDQIKGVGQDNPELSLTYSGFVNGDSEADLDTPPTASTVADESTVAGNVAISVSGGIDNNYDFNYVDGTLSILDAAYVTSVTVPDDDLYGIGDVLEFEVKFNKAVTVLGTTSLNVEIGGSKKSAGLNGTANAETTLIFAYTIQEGDLDSDGISLGSTIGIASGGSIKDALNVDALLTLNNVEDLSGVLVDGVKPTVVVSTDASAIVNTSFSVTVEFDSPVTGFDANDLIVTNGTAGNFAVVSNDRIWTFDITPSVAGDISVSVLAGVATDAAGNGNMASNTVSRVYNQIPTDIGVSSTSIQENNAIGDLVGSMLTTDADAADSHTYTLVSGTGDTDNASFMIDNGVLRANEVFDFETKTSYNIRVGTEDSYGASFEKALTINIENEGEAIIVVEGEGDFEATILGLSTTQAWTVTNYGDVATEVRIVSSTQGFSFNPGSLQVEPGESIPITAIFRPTEARAYTGVAVFNYDITDNIQDNVIEVNLSGEGVIVTGTDNGQIDEEQINIYPNPASSYVTIDLSELNGMPLDIQMINPTGVSKLEKEGYDKPELTIDVTNFESGLYIIQFSNERSLVRKKVLIRK